MTTYVMDELQKSYRHHDRRTVEKKHQESIDIVEKFTQKNGFKLFTSKTSILHFTKLLIPPPIELRLGNNRIKISETVNYLGLVFHSKLH